MRPESCLPVFGRWLCISGTTGGHGEAQSLGGAGSGLCLTCSPSQTLPRLHLALKDGWSPPHCIYCQLRLTHSLFTSRRHPPTPLPTCTCVPANCKQGASPALKGRGCLGSRSLCYIQTLEISRMSCFHLLCSTASAFPPFQHLDSERNVHRCKPPREIPSILNSPTVVSEGSFAVLRK